MPSRQRSMRSKTSRRGRNKETGSIASIGSTGTAQRADTILAAKPPPTPLKPQNPSNLISREVSYPFMMEAWNKESEMQGALQSLLIMEGGAMRGLFTAGVLDAFMEEGLYFPCSMGISAGSMQGLCYLAHQRGRSLRMNTRFAKDPRYMGLRHLVKRGSYFNFHFIFGELSESIDPYDFEAAEKSKETLYIIMTDAFTGYIDAALHEGVQDAGCGLRVEPLLYGQGIFQDLRSQLLDPAFLKACPPEGRRLCRRRDRHAFCSAARGASRALPKAGVHPDTRQKLSQEAGACRISCAALSALWERLSAGGQGNVRHPRDI